MSGLHREDDEYILYVGCCADRFGKSTVDKPDYPNA